MAVVLSALTTELNTDPTGVGYKSAGVFKSDFDIATLLNTIVPGSTVTKAYVDIEDVVAAIDMTEYGALVAANKTFLNEVILKAPRIKSGDANMRATIGSIFAAGTTTRTRLQAIATRTGTRAEVLFGEGATVSDIDVANALGRMGV